MNDFLLIFMGIFILLLIFLIFILLAYVYHTYTTYTVDINKNLETSEDAINNTSTAFNTLQDTVIVRETVTQSSESLQRVEEKLDAMLSLYNQGKLGLEAERQNMKSEVQANLKELEQLIMPLLVNLMKNPEKEYIYWPNRTAKIQDQIDKVLVLTRG